MVATEGGEAILEGRASRDRGRGGRDQLTDRLEPASPDPALADAFQSTHLEQAEPICLLERAFQATFVADLGEVEERAGHGGDRNPVARRPFVRLNRGSVEVDVVAPGPAMGRCHLHGAACTDETPECRCAAMTQQRSFSTAKYGGKPSASQRNVAVPNGIDAAMQDVQTTRLDPLVDCATSQAKG